MGCSCAGSHPSVEKALRNLSVRKNRMSSFLGWETLRFLQLAEHSQLKAATAVSSSSALSLSPNSACSLLLAAGARCHRQHPIRR